MPATLSSKACSYTLSTVPGERHEHPRSAIWSRRKGCIKWHLTMSKALTSKP
jgi:hypothetical protein